MTPNPFLGTFFTAAGFLLGTVVFFVEARRRNMTTEGVGWIALFGAACGAVCAKVGEGVFGGGTTLIGGGRTIIGALAGGWLAVVLAKRALGITRTTGDLWALALASGEAVGRIGCFFHTCCWGAQCDLPWAVYSHEGWRHPAQLYAAAWCALLFIYLWRERARVPEGALFPRYLIGWGVGRFLIELVRAHDSAPIAGLSTAQWCCLVAVGYGVWRLNRVGGTATPPLIQQERPA